jgi:hypothetical protein
VRNEVQWGKHKLCHDEHTVKWLSYIEANCHSCVDGANICSAPPQLLFHMSLQTLSKASWQGNLLAIQAFLMTQDLRHSKLVLWAPSRAAVYDKRTAPFFDAFRDYVSIRTLDWAREVVGTPFEGDPFFGDHQTVLGAFTKLASYSDVVRALVLHNYGGMWLDNDMVLFRYVRTWCCSGMRGGRGGSGAASGRGGAIKANACTQAWRPAACHRPPPSLLHLPAGHAPWHSYLHRWMLATCQERLLLRLLTAAAANVPVAAASPQERAPPDLKRLPVRDAVDQHPRCLS